MTKVLLRQLSDEQWYAIGAISGAIKLESQVAGATIDAPLAMSGSSRGFEGTAQVETRSHRTSDPLGTGIVMGGSGPDLAPFSCNLQWQNPGTGVLLLFVSSVKDGSVWTAAAVPVGFAG